MTEQYQVIYFGFNNPLVHKRGVENVILFQSQSLEKDIEKYYVFFGNKDEEFIWENIKCISIKHDLFRFFKLNLKIREILKKGKTIIHSHNYLMSFFLWRNTDIFTVNDGLYYLSSQVKHKYKNIFKIIEKAVYRKSKLIHFISEFSKKQSLYKGNKDIIIYITTPLEKVQLKNGQKKWIEDKIKIFTVRSIEERANIELLIELAEKNPNYSIRIAGKGPLFDKYNQVLKEKNLKNFKLLGYISDEEVVEHYAECDLVTVIAKYGEGFGLPIIEGYLHNRPVFASNTCAIPEIVINNKFLVENNSDDLTKKIKDYLNGKEGRYNFKEYYNSRFSYKKILSEYKEMYDKVLKNL